VQNNPLLFIDPSGLKSSDDNPIDFSPWWRNVQWWEGRGIDIITNLPPEDPVLPPGTGEAIGVLQLGPGLYKTLPEMLKYNNDLNDIKKLLGPDQPGDNGTDPKGPGADGGNHGAGGGNDTRGGGTPGDGGKGGTAPGSNGGNGSSGIPQSGDPNAKYGPSGFGTEGFIAPNQVFPYRIDFENESTATAPAQRVDITDQLDHNLDWNTFQLAQVGFGDTIIDIPPGSQNFETAVPVTENGHTFDVDIELGLNPATGQVYAHFLSIDPNTQLPPDVLTGFLPPDDGTGRGMEFFSYIVQPKVGLVTGTQIRNVALVTFDLQPAIATDQVDDHDPSKGVDPNKQALNTIDAGAPTSSVAALPATTTTQSFTVTWSGSDDAGGSGIAGYDIFVSDNGGPFVPFQMATAATSGTFKGQNGHTYAFYSVAIDNVGNRQATPSAGQTSTHLVLSGIATSTSVQSSKNPSTAGDRLTFTAIVAAQSGTAKPTGSVQFIVDGANLGSPVALVNGAATSPAITTLTPGNHTVTADYLNADSQFAPSMGTLSGGQEVDSTTRTGTQIDLVASSSSPVYGQSLTFTATVAPASGNGTPTGTVQFAIDGTAFGAAVTLVNGAATSPSIASLGAGSHAVTATYSGDPFFIGNSGTIHPSVGKANLTVTANPESKVYGAAVPVLTYTISGFVNGDSTGAVSGTPRLNTPATVASGVGSYPITIAPGTLAAPNYDFPNLVAGALSVTPAPLTITADDQSRAVGEPNPPLTASYSGFVNGDGPSSLTSPAVLTTTADTNSPAGAYPITVGGAASPNYAITFIAGMLTVTPLSSTPPPLVTVTHVQMVLNKKHLVTQILVTFSGPVNATEAQNPGIYRLATAGKKGSFTAKNAKLNALKSASYSAVNDTVTLTPRKPFKLSKPIQLQVNGLPPSGLEDSVGRLIDGNHDGQPGGNAVGLLGRGGATISAVALQGIGPVPSFEASAIDALLEQGDLTRWLHASRAKRSR
jgi:hypothetical protein